MNDVTRLIDAAASGDASATDRLLPIVYDELRKLAAARMVNEPNGHTLQATELVHEAYLRLIGNSGKSSAQDWDSRGHFFAAAAEAMRRILVEHARRKSRIKHGGKLRRTALSDLTAVPFEPDEEVLAVDEWIDLLGEVEPLAAQVVKYRYFAAMPRNETASAVGVSERTVDRLWAFGKAWLYDKLKSGDEEV